MVGDSNNGLAEGENSTVEEGGKHLAEETEDVADSISVSQFQQTGPSPSAAGDGDDNDNG